MGELRGQIFGGCVLDVLIGRGGMGEVYKALQKSLEREVAVKILPVDMAEDPSYVERFMQEARSIARLSHSNVVQVYDAGQQGQYYYILMELVEGGTLKDLIGQRHLPKLLEAVDFMEQAAMGLAAAHQQGIVHRDLKPGNIMLGPNRQVKVTDFGLAKAVQKQEHEITKTGEVVGTPAYMSPEQCEGGLVDHRSDIYSLGATFYHFVCGKTPFSGEGAVQVMLKHVKDKPEPPAAVRPDVPMAMSNIIDRCMAKDPYDRYQSCEELILDLHRAADGKQVKAYVPGEGRRRFAATAEEATGVFQMPRDVVSHSSTALRKKELDAKEQEQRGDVEAARGRWSFALMAYREALKVYPDSSDLKVKVEDARAKVEEEALEQSLSKVGRLAIEGRFDQAYDVLAVTIKGATTDEQKQKARESLRKLQEKEQIYRRSRRRAMVVKAVLAVIIIAAVAFLYREYGDKLPWGGTPPEEEEKPADTPIPIPVSPEVIVLDDGPVEVPSTGSTDIGTERAEEDKPSEEAGKPDDLIVRMILDATIKEDEEEPPQQFSSTSAGLPASAESITRKRVSAGGVSVAVPSFLEETTGPEGMTFWEGGDPWQGNWRFCMTVSREDNDSIIAVLVDAMKGEGELLTARRWRSMRSFGRVPEVRARLEDGSLLRALVVPKGQQKVGLAIVYRGNEEDVFWQVYGDLLISARASR